MRPRLRRLTEFLFGQNFSGIVHVVFEDPENVGYEAHALSPAAAAAIENSHKMPEGAQAEWDRWVASL